MKKERIILSFFALLIGLAVAGSAFYLYQRTKTDTTEEVMSDTIVDLPTPTPQQNESAFVIEKPKNEDVITSQSVTVTGKTLPQTTIIAQSAVDDTVAKASSNGSFQLTLDIDEGLNIINLTAVFPDGTEQTEQRVITHSTETF